MNDESGRGIEHAVEFLTGREVARLDADPVLDRRDYWRRSQ
ncbi:hypothetical protein [Halobacterium litoreum]|uniref:Uncharacterized protein n=1 Tax=Halobacterium litoreum TaxID=2039234 RepID=A0ABD5NAH6_9EURY|nr:hypothetical protein [Halobacterium litoreum]